MSPKPAIEIDGLSKSYAIGKTEFWALRDISFSLEPGEVLGIIGRNGAGKTTLLRILSRITAPTKGRAILRGRVSSILEIGAGFHPDLTGRENVFLNGVLLGMSRSQVRQKLEDIVDFSEIGSFVDVPVKRYSSGMYLRLAFAVAACLESEIILADEVLAVGDFSFQQKCFAATESIGRNGRTVVWVSHNLGAISRVCHKCAWLDQGCLREIGPVKDVVMNYAASSPLDMPVEVCREGEGKVVSLRCATLEGGKGSAEHVDYTTPFTFVIEYDIRIPVRSLSVGLIIRTFDYFPLLSTADSDTKVELLGERKSGRYMSRVRFPERWLGSGKYLVTVFFGDTRTGRTYERIDALSFSVVDMGSPASNIGGLMRPGVLQPLLGWSTESINL